VIIINYFEYRINEKVYDWIKDGTKRIEVRLYNEKAKKIEIGDFITFITIDTNKKLDVKVIDLFIYPSLADLYNDFGSELVADNSMTLEKINMTFENIFGKEKVEKYDVLGIKFVLLEEGLSDNSIFY